jgi:hypothetical protein
LSAPAPAVPSERLAELQRLRDAALITLEEYESKRREILSAI